MQLLDAVNLFSSKWKKRKNLSQNNKFNKPDNMNTRKANLRKLRLPSNEAKCNLRNGLSKAPKTVSNYFPTDLPSTEDEDEDKQELRTCTDSMPSTIHYSPPLPSPIESPKDEQDHEKSTRSRTRVKLKTFLPEEKRIKPASAEEQPVKKRNDFETPAKTVKAAPKTKHKSKTTAKTKSKRPSKNQPTIKSAFFQNEQLFSDVTAQHCLVDNVNPDEMQLALALSRSEVETSGGVSIEEKSSDSNEGIREKLKKFGFKVAESEEINYAATFKLSKGKQKWANKFTPLTLRNSQRQLEKVQKHIEHVLRDYSSPDQTTSEEEVKHAFSILTSELLPFQAKKHIVDWDGSLYSETVDFYVLSLFEPSKTKPEHLLKDMRRIPGRDRSPKRAKPPSKDDDMHEMGIQRCESPVRSIASPAIEVDPQLQSPAVKKSKPDDDGFPIEDDPTSNEVVECSQPSLPSTIAPDDSMQRRRKTPSFLTSQKENSSIGKEPNQHSSESYPSELSSGFQVQSQTIRATSPDIFADSDVEMESDEAQKMETLKFTASEESIETFEIFSSDEVKTFPDPKVNDVLDKNHNSLIITLDLTQQDSCSPVAADFIPTSESVGGFPYLNDLPSTSFYSKQIDKTPKLNGSVKETNPFDFSSSTNNSKSFSFDKSKEDENCIDLTQNEIDDNDNEEEIDCIVLSDDEINYSIRKADKSLHFKDEQISPDESFESNSIEKQEFSFIDLVTATQSFPQTQSEEFDFKFDANSQIKSVSSLDLDLSKASEFGILEEKSPFKTPTKTPRKSKSPKSPKTTSPLPLANTKCHRALSESFLCSPMENLTPLTRLSSSNSPIKSVTSLDLSKPSEFGILEEQSPFKTPTKTPRKSKSPKSPKATVSSTKTKCRRTLSESFLCSPMMENVAPIKRFSSSNKFKAFAKNDEDSFSDLDDIDKLIYGSPTKKLYKKPTGLTQLLTGTINDKLLSPEKPSKDDPQEFNFNGRTYLVRTVDASSRPNFATMDESELLDRLYRYGIKPLKRKQAEKILEYIYNQTHPRLIDETDLPSTAAVMSDGGGSDDSIEIDEDVNGAKAGSKFNLKDCWGHVLVPYDVPSMEIKDEQYFFQTNTSKKISTAALPLHIAWYNLVKSNTKLNEAILYYEPIDLQEVYLFLKSIGYRYNPKDLKYFFDSRSIIFRYDVKKSESTGGNRHVRKKKKQKIK